MVRLNLMLSRCSNSTMGDKRHERESRTGQGVLKAMGAARVRGQRRRHCSIQ